MKIIHVLNTGSYSGAENVAITIINRMKNKNDITYVSLDGPIREYIEENNINYEPVKKISINEIKKVIKKYDPDIIHAHDFTTSIICALVCGNRRLISHIHNNPLWIKKINIYSIAYLLSSIKYKKVLLVSKAIEDEYVFSKIMKNKFQVVGNPLDIDRVINLSKKQSIQESYDIIFLGRFSEQKNPIKFIEIIKKISTEIKQDISAVMIGDGPLKEVCINIIKQQNLNNKIKIKNFMKNPYTILNNSRLLCMTSQWEGYGLVAIEALSLKKPVVATNVGGIPQIVNERCGKITNNIDEMIKEIDKLINDNEYYNKKSNNAIERAKELNNIDEYIKRLEEIYNQCINKINKKEK